MALYVVLILILIIGSCFSYFFEWFDHSKAGFYTFWGICIILIFLAGFRYYVGTDFEAYKNLYGALRGGHSVGNHFEFGYVCFMWIVASTFSPYIVFFCLASAAIVLPVAVTVKRESKNPIFSLTLFVLLYFFFASMNIMRQYMAAAIVFWAANKYISEKKLVKYCVAVAVAALFHTSACLCVLLYAVNWIKFTKKNILIILIVSGVFVVFAKPITALVLRALPQYATYIDASAGSAYSDLIMQLMTFLGLLYYYGRKESDQFAINRNLFYCCAIFSAVMSLLAGINIMFARMGTYFYLESVLSIPYVISCSRTKKWRNVVFFAFLGLGTAICIRYLLHNNGGVVPYRFALSLKS